MFYLCLLFSRESPAPESHLAGGLADPQNLVVVIFTFLHFCFVVVVKMWRLFLWSLFVAPLILKIWLLTFFLFYVVGFCFVFMFVVSLADPSKLTLLYFCFTFYSNFCLFVPLLILEIYLLKLSVFLLFCFPLFCFYVVLAPLNIFLLLTIIWLLCIVSILLYMNWHIISFFSLLFFFLSFILCNLAASGLFFYSFSVVLFLCLFLASLDICFSVTYYMIVVYCFCVFWYMLTYHLIFVYCSFLSF